MTVPFESGPFVLAANRSVPLTGPFVLARYRSVNRTGPVRSGPFVRPGDQKSPMVTTEGWSAQPYSINFGFNQTGMELWNSPAKGI